MKTVAFPFVVVLAFLALAAPGGPSLVGARCAAPGEIPTFRVASGAGPEALAAALEASRKLQGRARRIVFEKGHHHLRQALALDARDSMLALEGAGAGATVLHGGVPVTGWRKDGERFWVADLPGAKTGERDFRALVVEGRLCARARLPREGRFEHESAFPVRWMSSAGGGWERKPTPAELTTLRYRAGDLGPWLSVRNAEVTIYHMWDESMVGLAGHDPATRTLTFASPSAHPPGAFGVMTYAIWNVREGMTEPGRWYLDRDAGRVVYWPLPGEEMTRARVVAPMAESVIEVRGGKGAPVRGLTVRGLTLSTTNTPCKSAGFGASAFRGALEISGAEGVEIVGVEIANTAGHGVRASGARDLVVRDCEFHHLGAGGCRLGQGPGRVEGSRIHHIGLMYPSAIGLSASGPYLIRRNEIHHTPYSGMGLGGGEGLVVEENLLYRCMQELHDGAAIYVSGTRGAILRRNIARDIVEVGKGYGASSYYLDEKCRDCVVERNVSIGVQRPTHNHMTLDCVVRDNVFASEGPMDLSFSRSAGFKVTGNTFAVGGELKVVDPEAVSEWAGNLIARSGGAPAFSEAMPRPPTKRRDGPTWGRAVPLPAPAVIDGRLGGEEWPPGGVSIGELPDQGRARGAPVLAKLGAHAGHLYIGVTVVSMFPEERRRGCEWGADEGVEIAVGGARPDGATVTHVLRGFTDGTFRALTVGGATEAEAAALAKVAGYGATVDKQVWRCEWRLPLSALGFTADGKNALPLNVTVYRSENRAFLQWAGTLGETWDLKRGGRLTFGDPSKR